MLQGQRFNTPISDILKPVTKVVNIQHERGYEKGADALPSQPSSSAAAPALPGTDRAQPGEERQEDAQRGLDQWRTTTWSRSARQGAGVEMEAVDQRQ